MKKLQIILRPDKLETLKELLTGLDVGGITVSSVMGCGIQKGDTGSEIRGLRVSNMNLLPKIQADIVVPDETVEDLLLAIHENISTGKVGDGKVFVIDVQNAMRIRTGERGGNAI
ncbi:MAG: P-II family nitrogen regulator [Coriobacteriales bacterium]|jgi:nitrogen regulatory protein P-II 1|nr:P-II family nitrogen regulator [Coriobacteriales bacterium]